MRAIAVSAHVLTRLPPARRWAEARGAGKGSERGEAAAAAMPAIGSRLGGAASCSRNGCHSSLPAPHAMRGPHISTLSMCALAIASVAAASHAAFADVKRHRFVPEFLRGSWAPSTEACSKSDKSVIRVSATAYTSSDANCTVVWVSETPGARGAIYSAHLLCSKPGEKTSKVPSDVIFSPGFDNRTLIGSRFSNLKSYQRCSASEPAPAQ
jgi:hypothetical protein